MRRKREKREERAPLPSLSLYYLRLSSFFSSALAGEGEGKGRGVLASFFSLLPSYLPFYFPRSFHYAWSSLSCPAQLSLFLPPGCPPVVSLSSSLLLRLLRLPTYLSSCFLPSFLHCMARTFCREQKRNKAKDEPPWIYFSFLVPFKRLLLVKEALSSPSPSLPSPFNVE